MKLSKVRIPSAVALILGFCLWQLIPDEYLMGRRGLGGKETDPQFIIGTAVRMGGLLITLFAAAGLLQSFRKWLSGGSTPNLFNRTVGDAWHSFRKWLRWGDEATPSVRAADLDSQTVRNPLQAEAPLIGVMQPPYVLSGGSSMIDLFCPTCRKNVHVSVPQSGSTNTCAVCGEKLVETALPPTASLINDPANLKFYYMNLGVQKGPASFVLLQSMFATSQLNPDDQVWSCLTKLWGPAKEIAGLFPDSQRNGERPRGSNRPLRLVTKGIAGAFVGLVLAKRGATALWLRFRSLKRGMQIAVAGGLAFGVCCVVFLLAFVVSPSSTGKDDPPQVDTISAERQRQEAAEAKAVEESRIAQKLKLDVEAAEAWATTEIERLKREAMDATKREQAVQAVVEKLKAEIEAARAAATREKAAATLKPAMKLTGAEVYERVLRSTAWILFEDSLVGLREMGSGVLVDRDERLVVTNYHVVHENGITKKDVVVVFPMFRDEKLITDPKTCLGLIKDPKRHRAKVIAVDPSKDLALLCLEIAPGESPPLPLSKKSAQPGLTVHSIGNPISSDVLWLYTSGTVRSAPYLKKWKVGTDENMLSFEATVIETQSPVNPGDSGGPLVNDAGELVAITQGFEVGASSLSYFIDVAEVREFLKSSAWPPPRRWKR